MTETEKFIDGLAAKTNSADKAKLAALTRRKAIEAVKFQFKEGLELFGMGVFMSPETMIDLIANYSDSGQSVTW
jgi:predicted amino acid dehydrogenase